MKGDVLGTSWGPIFASWDSTQRLELFEKLEKVEPNFLSLRAKNQVLILLYGSRTIPENLNQEILKNVIFYLKATTRFDRPLIYF